MKKTVPKEHLGSSDLRQALATLGATGIDDSTATTGLHANEETMRAGTTGLGRLVGTLHGHDELHPLASRDMP
jgi:hypothetical protein